MGYKDNYATKSVSFVCYCDNIDYIITSQYDFVEYCYIYHNKEKEVKPHYHVYIRFNNKKLYSVIAKDFNIDSSLIGCGNGLKNFCTYCLHSNETEKEKYDIVDFCGLFDRSILNKIYTYNEREVLNTIFIKIESGYTYSMIIKWCLKNDYMHLLRKYSQIIKDYIYNIN